MLYADFQDAQVKYKEDNPFRVWDRELRVPDDGGEYFFVLHDWQLKEFGCEPRQRRLDAVPSTRMLWGCKPTDFMPLNKAAQFWLYNLLRWAANGRIPDGEIEYYYTQAFHGPEVRTTKDNPEARVKCTYGSLKWAWEDFVADHRAFTDAHAPDTSPGHADYILGRNLDKPPFQFKSLITTGNIVRKIGSFKEYYIIEAIDITKPMNSVDWYVKNKPYLINWATEQTNVRMPDKKTWRVSKFPQLKLACRANGLPEIGTPFPTIGPNNQNWIKKTHVEPIKNGINYSPYAP